MSSRDALRKLDSTIADRLGATGLIDKASFAGIAGSIDGYFNNEFAELGNDEDAIAGLSITFDCSAADVPPTLEPEAEVAVEGEGSFRYLRSEPYGNGRMILILGTIL